MEKNYNVNVAKSRLSVGHTNNDNNTLKLWESLDTFNTVNNLFKENKKFVLLDGPPYANGQAHMGHALNKMLKDLVVKSRWFLGESVDYRPGWDCHGLPLELAVEKSYGKLDTDTMKTRCKQLAFRSVVKQRNTFKRLGVLGQWKNPYLTLSKDMVKNSLTTVKNLFDKNLLDYKQFPVHYCPACASSLAEAELESKVLSKDSLFFKMQVSNSLFENLYALVWTTTPWTLPMNQGLAFNSNFEYEVWNNSSMNLVFQKNNLKEVTDYLEKNNFKYSNSYFGKEFNFSNATSPMTKNSVPVLEADFVESGKTGFVHLSFSHGPEDFELGQQHNLVPHTLLNKFGAFELEENHPLEFLNNKKYTQVATLVVDFLTNDNLLVAHSVSEVEQDVCWRHKCGVYFNATLQAFLKLEEPSYHLKNKVSELLNDSSLSLVYKNKLESMLLSRKHWCLSRQRKWGCPINLLVDKNTNNLSPLTSQYLDLLVNEDTKGCEKLLLENPNLYVFDDVLDVWFDSGNVANSYLSNHDNNHNYVADLVLEGKDQFRGWFQSLLWLSVAQHGVMPYNNLLSHGFVLDENRNKFSKSSGTGSVVNLYADSYGADVLHLWTASQEPELDSVFSKNKLEEVKQYYSRFRLSLRFSTSNLYDYDYSNHQENLNTFKNLNEWDLHKFVLLEMLNTQQKVATLFTAFQFKKALETVYLFTEKMLSNFYFDTIKNPLYLRSKNDKERVMTQCALFELMNGLFDLVKVFTPFVAEEFYQDFYNNNKSVFEEHYFNNNKLDFLKSLSVQFNWQNLLELRKKVQLALEPLQRNKSVKSRTEVNVVVSVNNNSELKNMNNFYKLSELLSVSNVELVQSDTEVFELVDLKLNSEYTKCPRCWNYELVKTFNNDLCECCFKAES